MKLIEKGREFLARGRWRDERGAIDIGGILVMGIGMVFLAVGFIMYPIVMTATDALLLYSYSANATCAGTAFTGFIAIVGITPLLVLVGYLSAAVFSMYLGIRMIKGGPGGTTLDLGTMLMLGISLIFIAIGLIIMPVALDGVCAVLSLGYLHPYSGLVAILDVTPILILISFISGAVLTGFFGLKRLSA